MNKLNLQPIREIESECPEESNPTHNDNVLGDIVLKTITVLQQAVHYKDLTDIIAQDGYEFTNKQPERSVLTYLTRLVKDGKVRGVGKGYYEAIEKEEMVS